MTNKEKYRELCKEEKGIPIFSKDWWLDAVCGEGNWNVVLVENGGEIIASLPYFKKKKYLFNIITMPLLTQNFKLWIRYPKGQKYAGKLAYEKKVIFEIINKLPKCDMFNLNFHYSLTNWLPFYWEGFKQTTKYTYVIEDLKNIENVFLNFSKSKRKDIKKAEKNISIVDNLSLKKFYEINKLTFERQNLNIPYSFGLINKIDIACDKNNCRKIFFAVDKTHKIHAVMYCIYDDISVYCIMGGQDPSLRYSGAKSLINFEAMKFASKKNLKFDFEGSMIRGVEEFYRSFGSIQKPYFNIIKINSKVAQLAKYVKDTLKKW
ncbi:MAG: methicillin resistance protein [Promethearchaeia archaeon]